MAEENGAAETQQGGKATGPQFAVERIYLKDLSYEAPLGVEAFTKKWSPKVNQDVNTKVRKVGDNRYEVVLTVTASVKDGDTTIYLIEVQQAGLFFINGLSDQQLPQALNSNCPALLFPYVREAIDSIALKGGFPALNLPPLNFDALFVHAVQQAKANAEAKAEEETQPSVN